MKWYLEIQDPYTKLWECVLEFYDVNFALQEKAFYESQGFRTALTTL